MMPGLRYADRQVPEPLPGLDKDQRRAVLSRIAGYHLGPMIHGRYRGSGLEEIDLTCLPTAFPALRRLTLRTTGARGKPI